MSSRTTVQEHDVSNVVCSVCGVWLARGLNRLPPAPHPTHRFLVGDSTVLCLRVRLQLCHEGMYPVEGWSKKEARVHAKGKGRDGREGKVGQGIVWKTKRSRFWRRDGAAVERRHR